MSRTAGVLALAGVAALAVGVILALFGTKIMPAYLAAVLFWLALPLGALPVLMGFELAGPVPSAVALGPSLRRLLMLLPAAAVLMIPVLLRLPALYPWLTHRPAGFAGMWYAPIAFDIRAVVYLLLWVALGLAFARPPGLRLRRGLAAGGLVLHVVLVTLAATDWVMSVQPGLHSSSFGVLVMFAQINAAIAVAILLAVFDAEGRDLPDGVASLLLASLGLWMFLQFTQFLTVWSANLPDEIAWYSLRDAGMGRAAEWFALAATVLPLLLLHRQARRAGVVAAMAALLLLTHLVEMLWLVTPSLRGRLVVTLADVVALLCTGCLALAWALAVRRGAPPDGQGVAHG
jgi:hypothetical protein